MKDEELKSLVRGDIKLIMSFITKTNWSLTDVNSVFEMSSFLDEDGHLKVKNEDFLQFIHKFYRKEIENIKFKDLVELLKLAINYDRQLKALK